LYSVRRMPRVRATSLEMPLPELNLKRSGTYRYPQPVPRSTHATLVRVLRNVIDVIHLLGISQGTFCYFSSAYQWHWLIILTRRTRMMTIERHVQRLQKTLIGVARQRRARVPATQELVYHHCQVPSMIYMLQNRGSATAMTLGYMTDVNELHHMLTGNGLLMFTLSVCLMTDFLATMLGNAANGQEGVLQKKNRAN